MSSLHARQAEVVAEQIRLEEEQQQHQQRRQQEQQQQHRQQRGGAPGLGGAGGGAGERAKLLPPPTAAAMQQVEEKDKAKAGRFPPKRSVKNQVRSAQLDSACPTSGVIFLRNSCFTGD